MRWSLISTISILAVSVGVQVAALPAPLPASDETGLEVLEARARRSARIAAKSAAAPAKKAAAPARRTNPPRKVASKARTTKARTPAKARPAARQTRKAGGAKPKAQGGKVTAKQLKASSKTYRNAAAKSKNGVYKPGRNGKLTKSKGNGKPQKGMQADHIVEAQTLAHAVNKSRRKPSAAAMRGAKKILNSPKNMAYLDPKTNNRKGKDTAAALKGRRPSGDPNVRAYMKDTKKPGLSVARQLQSHFRKHRTPVNIRQTQTQVLKANGVRRRELVPEENLDALN